MKLNIEAWKNHVKTLEEDSRALTTHRKQICRWYVHPNGVPTPTRPQIPDFYTRIGISGGYSASVGSDLRIRYECMYQLLRENNEKGGAGNPYMTMLYSLRAHMRKNPRIHRHGGTLEEQAAFLEKTKPLWQQFMIEESATQELATV